MLKIGHRGAPAHMPENTLAGFRYAMQHGMNGLEFDVWACRTGEAVVIHDDNLQRTTHTSGYVQDIGLFDLQQLNAGAGERIPTLREVFVETLGHDHVTLFVELKTAVVAQQVVNIIQKYVHSGVYGYDRVVVISFLREALLEVHQLDHQIQLGLNFDDTAEKGDGQFYYRSYTGIADIIEQGTFSEHLPYSLNPRFDLISDAMVALAHTKGMKVFGWGLTSKKDVNRANVLRLDGVMVDDPTWVQTDYGESW